MDAENLITWKLTQQQAQQVTECLDIAVKAGGLQAAKVVVPLMDSLVEAIQCTTQSSES